MINRNKGGYSILPNEIFKLGLSSKAIGIYCYMNSVSLIEDWNFSYEGLMSCLKEGEKALRSGIKELKEVNLIVIIPKKSGKSFCGQEWIINPTQDDINRSKPRKHMELAVLDTSPADTSVTASAKTITEKNNTYLEKSSKEDKKLKIDVLKFRPHFIKSYDFNGFIAYGLSEDEYNYLEFDLNDQMYIVVKSTKERITKELAFEVWEFLYRDYNKDTPLNSNVFLMLDYKKDFLMPLLTT